MVAKGWEDRFAVLAPKFRNVLQRAILKPEGIMPGLITRITVEPGKRGGKPCIRGLRITVWDVLGWLGAGMTEDEILDEHPDLEKADFPAVYQYAAEAGRKAQLG